MLAPFRSTGPNPNESLPDQIAAMVQNNKNIRNHFGIRKGRTLLRSEKLWTVRSYGSHQMAFANQREAFWDPSKSGPCSGVANDFSHTRQVIFRPWQSAAVGGDGDVPTA